MAARVRYGRHHIALNAAPVPAQPPPANAATEIENFCIIMQALLPNATNVDPNLAQTSTRALIEVLHWFCTTIFPNALASYLGGNPAVVNATAEVVNLQNQVNGVVNAAPPGNVPNFAVLDAPAESPLELLYETVLQSLPLPHNFGTYVRITAELKSPCYSVIPHPRPLLSIQTHIPNITLIYSLLKYIPIMIQIQLFTNTSTCC